MTTALKKALSLPLPLHIKETLKGNDWVQKVMAFHSFYNVPMRPLGNSDPEFGHMSDSRVALRAGFQVEELLEFFEKGLGIKARVVVEVNGYELDASDDENIEKALAQSRHRSGREVADAAVDSAYFWIGFLLEMGYDMRSAFGEAHGSNLTKPDENGQPILNGITPGYQKGEDGYRPDQGVGKVLKGPNYMEPNLDAALGLEG
jgi:predicted HAD superfamily Cof-like phosphohydrolase